MDFESDFRHRGQEFVTDILNSIRHHEIDLPAHWDIDHLCFRTRSIEEYYEICHQVSRFGELLIESPVGGRPIATYKLFEPWTAGKRRIDLVEIPAPKPSRPVESGFEHLEIVADQSFEEVEKLFCGFAIDRSGLKKTFNPELEIKTEVGNMKFHPLSLESVIRFEKSKASRAVFNSGILELLADHSPLIAGTFPLGLGVSTSDVDVLIELKNENDLVHQLETWGQKNADLKWNRTEIGGLPTRIARFQFQDTAFEIFAQTKHPVRQKANLHFLVEERLLKRGTARLREAIQRLRGGGCKTEAAFAMALGLKGDPYQILLELQPLDDEGLDRILASAGFLSESNH